MLFLAFKLDRDTYAVDVSRVEAVLPLVRLKGIPRAPAGVAGLLTYHGEPVPVLDLSELALGRPARASRSTRLLLVSMPDGAGRLHRVGLIAEQATETVRVEASDFVDSGVKDDGTPYLGPVLHDPNRGLIQWIEVDALLPVPVRELLFRTVAGEGVA